MKTFYDELKHFYENSKESVDFEGFDILLSNLFSEHISQIVKHFLDLFFSNFSQLHSKLLFLFVKIGIC